MLVKSEHSYNDMLAMMWQYDCDLGAFLCQYVGDVVPTCWGCCGDMLVLLWRYVNAIGVFLLEMFWSYGGDILVIVWYSCGDISVIL